MSCSPISRPTISSWMLTLRPIILSINKNIDKEDINNANQLGYKIKLLGVAETINNQIYQRVHPTLIKKTSYIASIDGVLVFDSLSVDEILNHVNDYKPFKKILKDGGEDSF